MSYSSYAKETTETTKTVLDEGQTHQDNIKEERFSQIKEDTENDGKEKIVFFFFERKRKRSKKMLSF